MSFRTQFTELLSRHQVYLKSELTEQGVQRVQVPPQILKDQEAQSIPSKRFCPPKFLDLPTALSLRKRRESFWQLCFGAIMRNYKCDTYLKTQNKRRLSLPHCNLTSFFVRQKQHKFWREIQKLCILFNYKFDTYLKTRSKRRSGEMQTELESS